MQSLKKRHNDGKSQIILKHKALKRRTWTYFDLWSKVLLWPPAALTSRQNDRKAPEQLRFCPYFSWSHRLMFSETVFGPDDRLSPWLLHCQKLLALLAVLSSDVPVVRAALWKCGASPHVVNTPSSFLSTVLSTYFNTKVHQNSVILPWPNQNTRNTRAHLPCPKQLERQSPSCSAYM